MAIPNQKKGPCNSEHRIMPTLGVRVSVTELELMTSQSLSDTFTSVIKNQRERKLYKRWKNCMNEDFAILNVKNWRSIAGRRAEWKKLLRKAQARKELSWQF
ncbi:hypothetical protein TNCV_1722241 [Trichonephila clavipes]|nr:hypothetical protein TNCV_1722241 [Trichonephila clavipes]